MNYASVICLIAFGFTAVLAAENFKTGHSTLIEKGKNGTMIETSGNVTVVAPAILLNKTMDASKMKASSFRTARQIGYGMQGGGLQSRLQGISSGYGYGYNNAVGLGGAGQQAGANVGVLPFFGRR